MIFKKVPKMLSILQMATAFRVSIGSVKTANLLGWWSVVKIIVKKPTILNQKCILQKLKLH